MLEKSLIFIIVSRNECNWFYVIEMSAPIERDTKNVVFYQLDGSFRSWGMGRG